MLQKWEKWLRNITLVGFLLKLQSIVDWEDWLWIRVSFILAIENEGCKYKKDINYILENIHKAHASIPREG